MRLIYIYVVSTFVVTLATLAAATNSFQSPEGLHKADRKIMFATNICMAKGGIGIITKNVHVNLRAAKNELIFEKDEKWLGLPSPSREIVVLVGSRVIPFKEVPEGFDLSKAIIVSFEDDKIRFFDFQKMFGGYYLRERK